MNKSTISTNLRRSIAIASLCAFVAAATAIWLGAGQAQAAADAGARAAHGIEHAVHAKSMPAPTVSMSNDAPAPRASKKGSGKTVRGKLNLNTATEEQFRKLPGVGPAKARRIIESRNKEGKFRRVRDLRRVKGFGYKTVSKLEPYLSIDGPNNLTVE